MIRITVEVAEEDADEMVRHIQALHKGEPQVEHKWPIPPGYGPDVTFFEDGTPKDPAYPDDNIVGASFRAALRELKAYERGEVEFKEIDQAFWDDLKQLQKEYWGDRDQD